MTEDGTAIAGEDYRRVKGRIVFKPGDTQQSINVLVIGDTDKENDETIVLRLHASKNATLVATQMTLTIEDDD